MGVGGDPTHVHMHAHACTHTHTHTHGKHDNFMQMATPLDLGKSREFPMMSYALACMCACMRAHTCEVG